MGQAQVSVEVNWVISFEAQALVGTPLTSVCRPLAGPKNYVGLALFFISHLQVVKAAEMLGATKIIGVDLKEWRGGKGMTLGMTDFINPTEDNTKTLSERIKDVTEGLGVDYSFECTGVSHLLNQALESTRVVCD